MKTKLSLINILAWPVMCTILVIFTSSIYPKEDQEQHENSDNSDPSSLEYRMQEYYSHVEDCQELNYHITIASRPGNCLYVETENGGSFSYWAWTYTANGTVRGTDSYTLFLNEAGINTGSHRCLTIFEAVAPGEERG